MGVEVVAVPYKKGRPVHRGMIQQIKTVLNPSFHDLWPDEWNTRPDVIAAIERTKPDCVLPFAFDAVLYTHAIRSVPRVAFQAEGPHINTYVNWKYDPAVSRGLTARYVDYAIRTFIARKLQERLYVALVRDLTVAAFAGPHYVQWAKSKGLTNSSFITTPVPDPVGRDWEGRRTETPQGGKVRILMIGHLHSTSNRSGLPLFFTEVMPELEKWGREKFEIQIVGRNEGMPRRFDSWRDHPSLNFRGPVYPPHQEFLSADILLVTVPAKTGSRVRILNGFTYGCCVVAHTANALGIPELKHNENALLAETGEGLAEQIIRAAQDPELRRRLGKNGRSTYEHFYTEREAGEQYLRYIDRAIALFKERE